MNINSRFTGAFIPDNAGVFGSLHTALLAAGVSDDLLKNIDSIHFIAEGNPAFGAGALIRTTNSPAGESQFAMGAGTILGPFECTYAGLLTLELAIPNPAGPGNGVYVACSSTQTPPAYRSGQGDL